MGEIIECLDEEELLEKFQNLYNKGEYHNCVTYIEKKLSVFSNKFYDIMIIYLNLLKYFLKHLINVFEFLVNLLNLYYYLYLHLLL